MQALGDFFGRRALGNSGRLFAARLQLVVDSEWYASASRIIPHQPNTPRDFASVSVYRLKYVNIMMVLYGVSVRPGGAVGCKCGFSWLEESMEGRRQVKCLATRSESVREADRRYAKEFSAYGEPPFFKLVPYLSLHTLVVIMGEPNAACHAVGHRLSVDRSSAEAIHKRVRSLFCLGRS